MLKKLGICLLLTPTIVTAQYTKPTITRPPTEEDAAKKTSIMTASRVVVPAPSAEMGFPITVPAEPLTKIEIPLSEAFEDFKRGSTLKYSTDPQIVPLGSIPKIRLNLSVDANKGDNSGPLDNTVAVSNENNVVSITNGIIEFYDGSGALTYRNTLSGFLGGKLKGPCDPKVAYDPVETRFIIFAQRCREQTTKSEIMIGFSTDSDPRKAWNFYILDGNLSNNIGYWFDYPKIGIGKDGLFISGNVFTSGNAFVETVVYQLDKERGFKGQDLRYLVWYDIVDKPATLQPATYAFNELNPKGAFLIGTTFRNGADHIKLYDVDGGVDQNTKMRFYRVATSPYYFFAHAIQPGNKRIDNGDPRIQDAVLFENKIAFIFTSGDKNSLFSRVNINILDLPSLTNETKLLGDFPNFSYAYPSINLISEKNEAVSIVALYNGTSDSNFPDIRFKTCSLNLNCSQEFVLKAGESTVDLHDRWGDYSGVAKSQSRKNELWLSSSYGKNGIRQTFLCNIGLSTGDDLPTAGRSIVLPMENLRFSVPTPQSVRIVIKKDGKEVTSFPQQTIQGENLFQIVTQNFQKGPYSIEVYSSENGLLKSHPFIKG